MAANEADGEDNGDNDEGPREVPTSAETRKMLRLPQNKAECSGGYNRVM